ncbi:hypothetical protein Ahia01_001029200, partial [Argonauta hians]
AIKIRSLLCVNVSSVMGSKRRRYPHGGRSRPAKRFKKDPEKHPSKHKNQSDHYSAPAKPIAPPSPSSSSSLTSSDEAEEDSFVKLVLDLKKKQTYDDEEVESCSDSEAEEEVDGGVGGGEEGSLDSEGNVLEESGVSEEEEVDDDDDEEEEEGEEVEEEDGIAVDGDDDDDEEEVDVAVDEDEGDEEEVDEEEEEENEEDATVVDGDDDDDDEEEEEADSSAVVGDEDEEDDEEEEADGDEEEVEEDGADSDVVEEEEGEEQEAEGDDSAAVEDEDEEDDVEEEEVDGDEEEVEEEEVDGDVEVENEEDDDVVDDEEDGDVVDDEEDDDVVDDEEDGDVVDDEEDGDVVDDEEDEEGDGDVEEIDAVEDEDEEVEGVEVDEEEEEQEVDSAVDEEEEEGQEADEEVDSAADDEEEEGQEADDEEEEGQEADEEEEEETEGEVEEEEADEEEDGEEVDSAADDEEEGEEEQEEADVETGDDGVEENGDIEEEEEEESECSSMTKTQDDNRSNKDPFVVHFDKVIPEESVERLESNNGWQKQAVKTNLGKCVQFWNDGKLKAKVPKISSTSFEDLHIKQRINIENLKSEVTDNKDGVYCPRQAELFSRVCSYQDIYFSEKNYKNQEYIEMMYCIHVLNHTLKSRLKVRSNNLKQKIAPSWEASEEYPDQGITRPKVLILVPFRETVRRIVSNFIKILSSGKSQTDNKKRFFSEYSSQDDKVNSNKPEDYLATFSGNIDDHFKIGLNISQKKLKIYTKFYSSDIIIGSPLGLRSVIGETKKDYDFLSSIEILVLDQTEIFLMQNWEHVMYILDHLHLQPKDSHGCDFSRVRPWAINKWNKYYRQTLILSSLIAPQINVIFNKYCFNYAGKLMLCPTVTNGSICQVALQIPMIFHRVESHSYSESVDSRFETFIKKILPKYRNNSKMFSTMIYIPSYFDFVRIRNYFIKNEIDFLQITEYSKRKDISATRSRFFLGKTNFILYTERCHFFFRTRLRGIRHIIFYELPLFPHFFSEVCNLINDVKLNKLPKDDATGSVLYSKYDLQRLAAVVGTNRGSLMLQSPKPVHMFVTDP